MLKKRILLLALSAVLLACGTAAADKFGYPVDLETMKMLEEQSSFEVRVTEKKVVLGNYDEDAFSGDGADALVVTVENGSGSEISSVEVGFIAVTEEGLTTDVKQSMQLSFGGSPEIKRLVGRNLHLAPGESVALSMRVDYDRFKGVRAMVASCTLPDGTVLVNPDFEQWSTYAYGLSSGSSTELD